MADRSRFFRLPLVSLFSVIVAGVLLVSCGGSSNSNGADDDADGSGGGPPANEAQAIFIDTGCAECHGEQGEGLEGETRSLQGTRMILDQFETRVRNGRGQAMPAYTADDISNEQIEILHEWLRNQ